MKAKKRKIIFILSYVNLPTSEKHYDRNFFSMAALRAFVRERHSKWSSYQIIVVTSARGS